jgi:hypothetical protein
VSADRTSRVTTSTTTSLRLHRRPQWAPGSKRVPLCRCGLRRTRGSSPRSDLAIQVSATPAGKVRRYVQPVGILAGVRHRHYSSGWGHHRDGNIFSCCLVWAYPDLAHEPYPRINLLLGRALRVVHSELRQRLSTTWRGGSPPRSEAGAWRNSPGLHLPLHQGMGTIPRISDASIITAFHQRVRDEKILEKLATHDVETVSTLFTLVDKCARAAEGRAWHLAPQTGVDQTRGTRAVS